jgi:hypothetical protein
VLSAKSPNAPRAEAIAHSVPLGQPTLLSGAESYDPDDRDGPDRGIVAFDWDLDRDGQFDDAHGKIVSHVYPAGLHEYELRVTDAAGDQDWVDEETFGDTPPTASFTGPDTVERGVPATYTSTSTSNTSVAWELGPGDAFDDGSSATMTFTFQTAGPQVIRLRAQDRFSTDIASRTITVVDTRPPNTLSRGGAPDGSSSGQRPVFYFDTDEPGGTFECWVDQGPAQACTSPWTAPEVTVGAHEFSIRARDASALDVYAQDQRRRIDVAGGVAGPG